MIDETREFLNVLNLKSQLINFDSHILEEVYKEDYDNYVLFLNSAGLLINNELAFLLLNNEEYIYKILSVASIHRFDDIDPEVKDLINQIVVACNEIRTMTEGEKYDYRYDYIVKQEELREVRFSEEEDLIYALNFDSFLAYVLQNDEKEYLYACDNAETIMSLNYIAKMCPSFFEDEKIMSNAQDKLDHMRSEIEKEKEKISKRKTISIYVDELGKKIQKILKR